MTFEIFTLICANIITGTVFFKYIEESINKEHSTHTRFILQKLYKLELEVNEIHEVLDTLDEKLHKKHINMKQSHELLDSKIDNFIISNYDITSN